MVVRNWRFKWVDLTSLALRASTSSFMTFISSSSFHTSLLDSLAIRSSISLETLVIIMGMSRDPYCSDSIPSEKAP